MTKLYAIFGKLYTEIIVMKKVKLVLGICLLLLILSCEGSDAYQGKWKALDLKGKKHQITFSQKEITIKDSSGKSIIHSYIQSGMGHHGSSDKSVDTYKILLNNGQNYQIYFPKNDESLGLIMDGNGLQIFTISRKDYLTYDDINK
jgi:ferredoxin-fold anticodon binding domain-containing protein